MLIPMDSRQLHYFRSVVDNGSFTHVAEALEMTQPSLRLSIRKLEKRSTLYCFPVVARAFARPRLAITSTL